MRTEELYTRVGLLSCIVMQEKGATMTTFDEQEFALETQRIAAMSEPELTLYLARLGISPSDMREKMVSTLYEIREAERREIYEHIEDLTIAQQLNLGR